MYKEYQAVVEQTASKGGFWDVHWGTNKPDVRGLIQRMRSRDVLARHFGKVLPREGRVLEAGCGVGQYVAYLAQEGVPIEGIDFSDSAVAFAKSEFPGLPVRVGDLRAIPEQDNAFDAILCFGVIEHFENGPDDILRELRRVLSPSGRLYISVPYESLTFRFARKIANWTGRGEQEGKGTFYQYRFRRAEFRDLIRRAGFGIEDVWFYGGIVGIKRRLRLLKQVLGIGSGKKRPGTSSGGREASPAPAGGGRLARCYLLVWFLETQLPMFAHMIMISATKSPAARPETDAR